MFSRPTSRTATTSERLRGPTLSCATRGAGHQGIVRMAYNRLFPARNAVVMKRQAAISTLVLAILLTLAATMLPLTSTTGDAAAPAPGSQAIEELLQRAASHVARGQLDQGAATLEWALRIAPRDAQLWQQLAEVRLLQGELKQAEAMAKKSNQLTQDVALRARNDALIVAAQGSPPTAKASPPPSSSTSADLNRLTVEIERRRVAEMQVARLTEELSQERARREAAAVQRDETRRPSPPASTRPSAGYAEHGFKSADDEPPAGHHPPPGRLPNIGTAYPSGRAVSLTLDKA
jgi:tetratricopeptide (TPR) repeat protein